jgi:DNA-binding transcriptional regulator YdaS (Cro superfamily)
MDAGKKKAIDAAGGVRALARLLGIDNAAIVRWGKVPAERIIAIERLTLVPREELRPDLYLAPRPKPRRS